MPELWQVTIVPTEEQLRERGLLESPSVTGTGQSPEAARADARRRLAAWMDALELLELAERGAGE